MRNPIARLFLVAALASISMPAHACRISRAADLADLAEADLVVVGKLSNYTIKSGGSYAQFDILVDKVLKGEAPGRVAATWDNSTFGLPAEMHSGQVLVALQRPASAGGKIWISANADRGLYAVLQRPCTRAFLFEADDGEAAAIENILSR